MDLTFTSGTVLIPHSMTSVIQTLQQFLILTCEIRSFFPHTAVVETALNELDLLHTYKTWVKINRH